LLQKIKNNCSKIHFYENFILGQKDMQSFFKVMHLAHCITFAISGPNVLVGNIIYVHLDFSKIQQKMCLIVLFKLG
jgi:hypothetical protein